MVKPSNFDCIFSQIHNCLMFENKIHYEPASVPAQRPHKVCKYLVAFTAYTSLCYQSMTDIENSAKT